MPPLTNFIFDWSGTLVDDLPPVLHATNAVLAHCGRPPLTREAFLHEFELPFQKFYDRLIPGVPLATLEPVFHQAFRSSGIEATPLPHSRPFLDWCRVRGHRCFVLSAAHPDHVRSQAHDFGFTPFFEAIHAGVPDKTQYIHHLLAAHHLDPGATTFIGDMTHDIDSARLGGVLAVAVLTGYQDRDRLATAAPDLVVRHLSELRAWIEPARSGELDLNEFHPFSS